LKTIEGTWSDNLKDYFKNLRFKKFECCRDFWRREAAEAVSWEILAFLGQ
jgi:hypothetical protein